MNVKQIINNMRKLTKFLIITAIVVVLEGLYFEFVVSRNFNIFGSTTLSVCAVILGLWYISYTTDFVMDILKLKNKQENNNQ